MSAADGGYLSVRISQAATRVLPAARPLQRLPLVTLYLTERCNSRCVTCDYWRHGRADLNLEAVKRLLPQLLELRTQVALISGGEPLLNPEWEPIACLLRDNGLTLYLLTSGLSLAKHAGRAAPLFNAITVSLDGTDAETYEAIRGLNAFDRVCAGVREAVGTGVPVSLRATLQRANYRQIPQFVRLARELGACEVSFIAVDVGNPHAFAREGDFGSDLALAAQDLPVLERTLEDLEREHAADFQSGLIAESPRRLRHILRYFTALCGLGDYPPVRCNAPEFSAVINARGQVSPCFFIAGPGSSVQQSDLEAVLNSDPMSDLRERIRAGERPECARCVCSLWRDPDSRETSDFLLRRKQHA